MSDTVDRRKALQRLRQEAKNYPKVVAGVDIESNAGQALESAARLFLESRGYKVFTPIDLPPDVREEIRLGLERAERELLPR